MPTYADFGGWVISTIAGWFVVTADSIQVQARLDGINRIIADIPIQIDSSAFPEWIAADPSP
jgi:hypothetical protein